MPKQIIIVLGTKNRHKIREMLAIWRQFNRCISRTRFIPLYRFPNAPQVKETGRTYLANAAKKAVTWARYAGLPVLAEDSGIEVKALGWKPGIYSARYASTHNKKNAKYKDNNQKILAELMGLPLPKRIARYRCSAVLASPKGRILTRAEGTCWGLIALKPAGQNGFGYDPIFIPKSPIRNPKSAIGSTLGQFPARLKHSISHRGITMRKILKKLPKILDIS